MKTPVYITGLGSISGAGKDTTSTMQFLFEGKRDPQPPKRIKYTLDKQYPVFEVQDIEGEVNDLSFRFAEIAAGQALAQSGLDLKTIDKKRVGVFLGSTAGCFFNEEEYYKQYRDGKEVDRSYMAKILMNGSLAHRIAAKWDLNGPAMTLSNACASGTDAIGMAAEMIERGDIDIAIAGGTDEIVRMVYLGFISLMNTSEHPCRPFSKTRQGLNLGEGSGICILENEKSAEIRKAEILGEVMGYSTQADAYHVTAPEPTGRGLRKAFKDALSQAGLQPQDISFINTHGTATSENDKVEGAVIADLFGKDIAVTATKAYTGHALGAAGGLEAVFTTLFLNEQRLPGVPGYDDFDEICALKPHSGTLEFKGRYACSTSLAFGGVNSVIVIGRPE